MKKALVVSVGPPWLDFLSAVDSALSRRVQLHCIGGFVLGLVYGMPRPTGDIDYFEVLPRDAGNEVESIAGRESAIAKKHKLFIQAVGIADLPDGYQARLQELALQLRFLNLCVLDPYDLLLSKVSRNSPKDREDAKYLIRKKQLHFEVLHRRWRDEMAPWIANPERHERTLQLWKEYF